IGVALLGATIISVVPDLEVGNDSLSHLSEQQHLQQHEQQQQQQQHGHKKYNIVRRVRRETQFNTYDWTPETNACIIDYNNHIFNVYSLFICKALCKFVEDVVCRSIEFYPSTGGCSLSEATSHSLSYRAPCPNKNVIFTEISTGETTVLLASNQTAASNQSINSSGCGGEYNSSSG
ncbi:unnamed protein product, partial [Meganyctiphanes norvegica]